MGLSVMSDNALLVEEDRTTASPRRARYIYIAITYVNPNTETISSDKQHAKQEEHKRTQHAQSTEDSQDAEGSGVRLPAAQLKHLR